MGEREGSSGTTPPRASTRQRRAHRSQALVGASARGGTCLAERPGVWAEGRALGGEGCFRLCESIRRRQGASHPRLLDGLCEVGQQLVPDLLVAEGETYHTKPRDALDALLRVVRAQLLLQELERRRIPRCRHRRRERQGFTMGVLSASGALERSAARAYLLGPRRMSYGM